MCYDSHHPTNQMSAGKRTKHNGHETSTRNNVSGSLKRHTIKYSIILECRRI